MSGLSVQNKKSSSQTHQFVGLVWQQISNMRDTDVGLITFSLCVKKDSSWRSEIGVCSSYVWSVFLPNFTHPESRRLRHGSKASWAASQSCTHIQMCRFCTETTKCSHSITILVLPSNLSFSKLCPPPPDNGETVTIFSIKYRWFKLCCTWSVFVSVCMSVWARGSGAVRFISRDVSFMRELFTQTPHRKTQSHETSCTCKRAWNQMRNTSIHDNFLFLTFADVVKMEHNLSFSLSANGPYDEHLSVVLLLL